MADEETSAEEGAQDAEEVLSDAEKDALLEGMADGSVVGGDPDDARHVRAYEIRPDAYINYGSYPRLQAICSQFSKRLAQRWSALTQAPLAIGAEDAFDALYGQAVKSLPAPVLTYKVALDPLPGHSIVIIDNPLLGLLVEGFFGFAVDESEEGEAEDPAPAPPAVRDQFTAGETRVAELALKAITDVLRPAWEKLLAIKPQVLGKEVDPTVGTGLEPKDQVIVARFAVQSAGHAGVLHWILPLSQVRAIADDLEGATNARPSAPDPVWYPKWCHHTAGLAVAASVRVGRAQLTLREVVAMQPGDVVPLDAPDDATLLVGDVPCAEGSFGTRETANAFRLRQWTATRTT